jgi:PKD repeat protein
LTETNDNRTCTAVVVFPAAGTHTVSVTATDIQGATSPPETLTVNVTAAPANPAPVIDPNSFRVHAEEGPKTFCPDDEPQCEPHYNCPTGLFCPVPFDAVLFNGRVGDYHPPLTLSLESSDPNGDAVQVTWFCSAGSMSYPVTDNGDGSFSCNPYSSSTSIPIVVRAEVSDGTTVVRSEVRKFIMLDRLG